MASNDALKASAAEMKKRQVEALIRERSGYQSRLAGAEEGSEFAEQMQDRIDQVNAQLRHFGENAAAPAKKAERRPVSARAETR